MDDHYIKMAERIASLEAQAEHNLERQERNDKTLTTISTQLSALNAKITRWEGKFGGVIFVVTCIWVFLTGLPSAIINWVKAFGGIK